MLSTSRWWKPMIGLVMLLCPLLSAARVYTRKVSSFPPSFLSADSFGVVCKTATESTAARRARFKFSKSTRQARFNYKPAHGSSEGKQRLI